MLCFSKAAPLPLSALAAALSLAGLAFIPAPVEAQAPNPTPTQAQAQPLLVPRADPADPQALVPAMVYRSSLDRYRAFATPELAAWRDSNDLVRQRGGWKAYAREATEPAATATPSPVAPAASQPATSAKPTEPAMAGHAGHGRP